MNQTITIGIAALLAGGVGGFVVGNAGNDSAETDGAGAASGGAEAKITRSDARPEDSQSVPSRTRVRTLGEAMREPGQVARIQGLIDLYSGMDVAQLKAEAENLDALPFGDRIMASMLLFSRWGEIDPRGALAHTDEMGRGGDFMKPTVLRSWASQDPENAAKYYAENAEDFDRRGPGGDGAEVIAREWAKLDPQGALAWARNLEGDDRSDAVSSVIGQMASEDPMAAAAEVASLDPDDQDRAYGEVAEQFARQDLEGAEAWIATLSGESKQEAMSEMIEVMAGSDPQGAAERIATMESGGERDRAIEDVAEAWGRENPSEAADWLVQQETGEADDAMRRIMGNWAEQDQEGALSFIDSQPSGEIRDSATQTYLWVNRDTEPTQAMAMAESISDDRNRARTIGMTAGRWMREDEDAARSYIQQTDAISPEMKERLLNNEGRGRWRGRR